MISYQNRNEIPLKLQQVLPQHIEECRECDALTPALENIIKHNFQASFVCYDKESMTIEVGVKQQAETDSYPEILVQKFKLDEAISRLKNTFKNSDADLRFYAKILAGNSKVNNIDDVVLM